jgi:hypothetical protein
MAIVLATMVSQAFAFETIRILEGYWGKYRPLQFMTAWRSSRHHKRMIALQNRYDEYTKKAFKKTKQIMLEKGVPREIIEIQEDEVLDRPKDPRHSPEAIAAAKMRVNHWRTYCPPAWSRRMEMLGIQLAQFPDQTSRILPTRLGNTLRSWEDQLVLAEEDDLEGMVLRDYDRIPFHLQVRHDQFRNRLDMYCTLAFVFFILALLAAILLSQGSGGWLAGTLAGLLYLSLAWMSYEAAISSARGYGSVLLTINRRSVPGDDGTA